MTYTLRVTKQQPNPKAGQQMEREDYNGYGNIPRYPPLEASEILMVELSEEEWTEERWILRIKEQQPPLSVYGCDPREVDLSQVRGPNNHLMEFVEFREPNPNIHELFLSCDTRVPLPSRCFAANSDRDKRRIIVREVEERKPRRFICEETAGFDGRWQFLKTGLGITRPRPLADPNDPKVVNSVLLQSNWNLAGSVHDQAKSLIEAYLAINPEAK